MLNLPFSPPLSDDLPRVRDAIHQNRGSITRAARSLGVTKAYAMNLVRKFDLNDWARTLRQENGLPWTGRPATSKRRRRSRLVSS